MKRKLSILALGLLVIISFSCAQNPHYWKGADIGWATEYEARGLKFYNQAGEERECTALMKELGLDAVRFRVWVDPSKHGNWNSREDLLVKAKRADDLGMAIMVNFHYSDFWADPKKQNIPASWSGKSYEEIKALLAEHTRDVLSALKAEGIEPKWVQVGNEISNGFLWTVEGNQWGDPIPDSLGRVTILESVGHLRNNPSQYAGLFAAGYDAVKEVFPKAKVIVHLDNGFNQALYDNNLDTLRKYGAKWDIIGMSLYPFWALDSGLETDEEEAITHCIQNINHVWEKYHTPVMIVETGFEVDESRPEVMEKGRDQLRRIIRESKATGHCEGIFYWEPECRPFQYKLGAFDSEGKPTVIMDGFNDELTLRRDSIDEVLSALTLKEKASLVVGAGYRSMLAGMFGFDVPVPGAAGMTRAVPRLGIPAIVLSDGPAGVRIEPRRKGSEGSFYCTGFPIGSLLSSTWNMEIVERVGAAIGNEALEYGVDVLLAPGMNIQRNPLCGRNFEYFSEDPLLSGKVAAAYVRGVQSQGVGTSVKHFAANNQETNRFWNDSRVSEDVLRDIYLRNFEIAVREAAPWTVMASYNRLNGIHTQEDKWLLTEVLRGEWGYEGLVMTDWTDKRNTAAQIQAGCDLMEPGKKSQIKDLVRKVRKGELAESDLDICVRRVLELVVKTPTFKGRQPSLKPDLASHALVAREAAEEGIVLLKNERMTLPLAKECVAALFGVGSYQLLAGGTGSGHVHRPYVIALDEGLRNEGITPYDPLTALYREHIRANPPKKSFTSKMLGSPGSPEMSVSRTTVEAAAAGADVAILTISRQAGEGGDRHLEDDFLLSDLERQLLEETCERFHAQGKSVVVVLNVGGVIETASWKHLPDAIVLGWQPGQEGGNALARILSGAVCPSGKLPVTFPVDYFDLPSSAHFPFDYAGRGSMTSGSQKDNGVENVGYTDYAEGLDVGYRYFSNPGTPEVSFPFGFGLSYTCFEVSEPIRSGNTVSVTVTNTGTVAGKEVVIVMDPFLRAFGKTHLLQPGESETLKLLLFSDN